MKLRVLTAAAVAAWSKTAAATTASVLPGVLDQPAGASVIQATPQASSCPSGPGWEGPQYAPANNSVVLKADLFAVGFKGGGADCRPGTASLQWSFAPSQWKSIDTQHATTETSLTLAAQCRGGTWLYRGSFVTDDLSFSGNSNPVAISC